MAWWCNDDGLVFLPESLAHDVVIAAVTDKHLSAVVGELFHVLVVARWLG